ncbi:Holin-like protein CidB [Fusarium oxysporum f. sp. cubense race 1]|uniref:Holin-like protein CidB n=1 Tax=Fusarium oxysporum f. sp. cubense (strain race 1) TaxID=1229664 RepID=N4UCE3_FUSC1|nr:Holin-like protein CidB [Fusarium oxysporum f. sp. cubense race 1]
MQAANKNSSKLVRAWFYVPLGITIILAVNFGVDSIFYKFNVSFPASVTCMVLLFFALIASESLLGTHKTRKLVNIIDVPAGWSLRWMGIFFTPSFVLLPLSPPIGIFEVMIIIAIFVIGFFIMMAMAAWITRSLQLALGVSRRSRSQRAEELGRQTPDLSTGDLNSPVNAVEALNPTTVLTQIPLPPPKAELWAARISANLDVAIFVGLFAFIGIPLYYSTGYAMPLHLAVNVLAWFGALSVTPKWKEYLHPVLVSSLATVLVIWALAEIRGDSLTTTLHAYRTGAKYIQLWRNATSKQDLLPGAGDVFGTLLDASIVALALPMFQYRRELRTHFISIVIPNVAISVGSLLAYPPLCYACGISAARSLAFASRSLTLALAVPATVNLGGDVNTAAALAIISGILGAVLGARILRWLRVPDDDYVTRGVTLGVNSSAIATSVLLRTDPRAAALSSLSMSLFGTITVLFTSIPPAAAFVRGLVGL